MGRRVAGREALGALLVDIGLALLLQPAGEVPMRGSPALRAAFRLPDGVGAFADGVLKTGAGHPGPPADWGAEFAARRPAAGITRPPAAARAAAAAAPSPARSAPSPGR